MRALSCIPVAAESPAVSERTLSNGENYQSFACASDVGVTPAVPGRASRSGQDARAPNPRRNLADEGVQR
jgi:hypothetical protein